MAAQRPKKPSKKTKSGAKSQVKRASDKRQSGGKSTKSSGAKKRTSGVKAKPRPGKPAAMASAKPKTVAKGKPSKSKQTRPPAKKKATKSSASSKSKAQQKPTAADKQLLLKQKQKEQAAKEKALLAAAKEKERLKTQKAKEVEKQLLLKQKQKEQAQQVRDAEKLRVRKERDAEKQRVRQQKASEKDRLKAERLAEKERFRKEKEAEKERLRLEREAERERLRKEKDAALEAYRKAKEQEQQRLRSEREAAKKALEGRVSRQAGRLRGSGARLSTSTRVYSPLSIPNQSGTRVGGQEASKFANLRTIPPRAMAPSMATRPPTLPPPPPERRPETVEERFKLIESRLRESDIEFRKEYEHSYLMSWIYHDSALEGVVYTYEELKTGIDPSITVVPDSTLQSVCDDIRRHKAAIELVREQGEKKRQPVSIDLLKRIYLTLHPEEGDLKTVKYRRDIPQHRLYFHEYAAPDKIAYKIRQVFDWLNGPEPKKLKDPLKIAGRVQYDLLRIFPFEKDSGKVARLFMNIILLRFDHPPAIVHSAERQRYYEALRGNLNAILAMLQESVDNALMSIEKRLDERETRHKAIIS